VHQPLVTTYSNLSVASTLILTLVCHNKFFNEWNTCFKCGQHW
jgi:hypothetical protein